MPEAQRTQGIASITWIIFLTEINLQYFLKPVFISLEYAFSDLLQIDSKFGHQIMSLALLGSKFGHQVVSLVLPNCLGMSYWHYRLVLGWYLHQPESHQLSLQKVSQLVRDKRTHRSDQGHLGPIKTRITTKHVSQLFERGSRRNIKSHFGAFNLQWALLSNWNPWLKYLSTFHFLTKMAEIFFGVKGDAKAAGNNFLRSLDTLEMLENG